MREYLRSDLRDFKPYIVEEGTYKFRLDANESPFSLDDKTKKRISNWLLNSENLNRYPDTDCNELREVAADFWEVKKQNVICGVGSDQIIDYITKAFLEKDQVVVSPLPSFSMYRLTTSINHGKTIEVPISKDENTKSFGYDIELFAKKALDSNAKIIILCNPNNPTGNEIPIDDIEKLLNLVSIPVVIDEAYGEFAEVSALSLIPKYKNLIVLKTLSKAYGIAGARVGFGIADKDFIDVLNIVKAPYNLNTISQRIAIEVMKDRDIYIQRIKFLKAERVRLMMALNATNKANAYSSNANFVYIESTIDIYELLKKEGIIIRSFGKNENNLFKTRITIGNKQENSEVIEHITRILGGN